MATKQYLDYEGLETHVENIKNKYATKDELSEAGKVKTVNNAEPDNNGNIEIETDDGEVADSDIRALFDNIVNEEDEALNPMLRAGVIRKAKSGVFYENGMVDSLGYLVIDEDRSNGYVFTELDDGNVWIRTKYSNRAFTLKNNLESEITVVIKYGADVSCSLSLNSSFRLDRDFNLVSLSPTIYVKQQASSDAALADSQLITHSTTIPPKGYLQFGINGGGGIAKYIIKKIEYSYDE